MIGKIVLTMLVAAAKINQSSIVPAFGYSDESAFLITRRISFGVDCLSLNLQIYVAMHLPLRSLSGGPSLVSSLISPVYGS